MKYKVKIIMDDTNITMDLDNSDYIALLENIKEGGFFSINYENKTWFVNSKYILRIEVEK